MTIEQQIGAVDEPGQTARTTRIDEVAALRRALATASAAQAEELGTLRRRLVASEEKLAIRDTAIAAHEDEIVVLRQVLAELEYRLVQEKAAQQVAANTHVALLNELNAELRAAVKRFQETEQRNADLQAEVLEFEKNEAGLSRALWAVGVALASNGDTSVPKEFDEEFYLRANPDVGAAVSNGLISSGYLHWLSYGFHEGRKVRTRRV